MLLKKDKEIILLTGADNASDYEIEKLEIENMKL